MRLWHVTLILLTVFLFSGCASNPRILRIFFDGVPDPEVQAAEPGPGEGTGDAAPAASPACARTISSRSLAGISSVNANSNRHSS